MTPAHFNLTVWFIKAGIAHRRKTSGNYGLWVTECGEPIGNGLLIHHADGIAGVRDELYPQRIEVCERCGPEMSSGEAEAGGSTP